MEGEVMRKMTEKNLRDAFAGESQAHMRYLIFAEKAEQEGFPNIAKLFRAIAYAEFVHAKNHYKELGEIKRTADNLQVAIDGETYEVEDMYPAFKAVAELQNEKGAIKTTSWALEAEKIHATMYQKTKQTVERGEDIEPKKIYVCKVCGYTTEGEEPPEKCPICGAPKNMFKAF